MRDQRAWPLPSEALTAFFLTHRLLEIDISSNKLSHLPPGFLHLSKLQKLMASKNYLEKLFEEESGMFCHRSPAWFVISFSIGMCLPIPPFPSPPSSHELDWFAEATGTGYF